MNGRFPALAPFAALAVGLLALPTCAQTNRATTRSAAPPKYDIATEVTLVATVSRVVSTATPEMKMVAGSHLMLETTRGNIDASLGVFPLAGDGALSVSPGERVQVTGVMKTIRDQQVFVTRLVLAGGQVYKIRNQHGFVLMPVTRKGTANSETKGGRL
jgi:hypothetical protein